MSCEKKEKLKELADKVQAAEDKFDSIINESPLGKINKIKNISVSKCPTFHVFKIINCANFQHY